MTNQDIVNDLAIDILEQIVPENKNDPKYTFVDPITILMIISIILTLIRVLQECRKKKSDKMSSNEKYSYFNSEIKSLCFNDNFLTRMRIKSAMKKHLNKDQYKQYSKSLLAAIIKTGHKVTPEQTTALLEYRNV